MESLTFDSDIRVLSLAWAVDLDFGVPDPFLQKIEARPRSLESKRVTNLINPNKLIIVINLLPVKTRSLC